MAVSCLPRTSVEVAMMWFLLVAVAVVVVALGVWAWRSSGSKTGQAPPGVDRARREADVTRDHGPSNHPTNPGGV
jgi:hypothetical protein